MLYFMRSGRGLFPCLQYEAPLKKNQKGWHKGVYVTRLAIAQVQPGEFISPNPNNMPVFQPCAFHTIFLILWFSLSIDNFPVTRIWLRFGTGLYPVIHVCLSISYQLCCKIKLLSFCVHLNSRPNCVIVSNICCPSIF